MSSFHDSLKMIDYYCQNKTLKDTVIVFYHAAKHFPQDHHSHAIHALDYKLNSYLQQKDTSKLDRQYSEAIKATRLIIQKHKTKIQLRQQIPRDNKQLSSTLLTPEPSINLEINSIKGNRTSNDFKQSDIFKTSWNHSLHKNDLNNIKQDNSVSIISRFGIDALNPSQSPQQLQLKKLQSQMDKQYESHKLDLAYKTSINIENLVKHSTINKSANRDKILKKINDIQFEYNQMISYYKQFDQPGWEFDNTSKNITLHSKTINGGQHVAVLITAELNIPLINFLVMVQEIDLFNKFVPFCGVGEEIKRVQRNLYVARSVVDMPFFTNRQTYFYAKMIDRLQTTDSLFFYSRSINNNPEACHKYGLQIPKNSSFVKLEYNFFIMQCKVLGRERIEVRMASSVDMKLNFIPNFILMMSARRFAVQYFVNIMKEQKHFKDSEWYLRLQKRKNIYGYYQELIDEYLSKN